MYYINIIIIQNVCNFAVTNNSQLIHNKQGIPTSLVVFCYIEYLSCIFINFLIVVPTVSHDLNTGILFLLIIDVVS